MTARNDSLGHAAKVRRFNRIKMHHPALAKLTASIPQPPRPATHPGEEDISNYRSDADGPSMNEAWGEISTPADRHSEWYSQFLKSLTAYRYEGQLELTSHLYGPHCPPPPGYQSPVGEAVVNPFRTVQASAVPLQSSMLTTNDAMKVFDGISFAMWGHGKALNAHVVIVWSMIRGIDQGKAAEILGKYLNEASKWVAVRGGPRAPTRQGDELHYVWVHENARDRGFHTHILMNLPTNSRKAFDAWSRSCLARLCKTAFHEKTFRVVVSRSRSEIDQASRVWSWYRYLMKQLNPASGFGFFSGNTYCKTAMRDVVKPWPMREGLPIRLTKRVGVSHSIGTKAQKEKGFISKLRSGEIGHMYQCSEFADRLAADLFKNEKYPPWHCEFQ